MLFAWCQLDEMQRRFETIIFSYLLPESEALLSLTILNLTVQYHMGIKMNLYYFRLIKDVLIIFVVSWRWYISNISFKHVIMYNFFLVFPLKRTSPNLKITSDVTKLTELTCYQTIVRMAHFQISKQPFACLDHPVNYNTLFIFVLILPTGEIKLLQAPKFSAVLTSWLVCNS